MSEQTTNLPGILSNIQATLNAPKNQRNNFGKYNYRSCEDILQALKPHLLESNVFVTVTDDIVAANDRTFVKAVASISDGVASIQTTAFAELELSKKGMDASQLTGATSSYARKYALNGLFCIDDNKDADSTNNHGKSKPASTTKPASKPKADKAKFEEVLSYVQSNPKFLQGALGKFAWTAAQRKALEEAAA